jgi:hypothetical protein
MSTYAIPRPLRPSRTGRLLGQAAAGLLVAAIAAGVTWFINRRGALLGVAAVLVIGGSLWFATTRRTQVALALFMVYLGVLDGYLKLATGSGVITFLRDVLLFALLAGLLVRAQAGRTRLAAPPLTAWVVGFALLVLVQVFNPQGGTLVHSLAGVRQHLEFVPLFFLTFAFVRTTKALRGFVVLLLLIAAANGVVSLVQFRQTPQQLAGWGPGYAERVLGQGQFLVSGRSFFDQAGNNYTRPFGLGSEAGSGGLVGAFALGGVLALASLALSRRRRHLLFAIAMAIGAVTAIVTSQGRAVIVVSIIVALAYGLLTATSRGRVTSLLGLAVAGLVSVVVIQAIVGTVGSPALRYQGLTTSTLLHTTSKARGKSLADIPRTIVRYPLGAGLATAGPASGAPGATQLTGGVDAENEFSFMTLETGIAGMALITAFTVMLFILGLRRCRHEPDREARVLLAAIIAPVAGMAVLYVPSAMTATTPGGPYLWAAGGIVSYWLVARPAALRRAGAPAPER